jgi:hypothetical protein
MVSQIDMVWMVWKIVEVEWLTLLPTELVIPLPLYYPFWLIDGRSVRNNTLHISMKKSVPVTKEDWREASWLVGMHCIQIWRWWCAVLNVFCFFWRLCTSDTWDSVHLNSDIHRSKYDLSHLCCYVVFFFFFFFF